MLILLYYDKNIGVIGRYDLDLTARGLSELSFASVLVFRRVRRRPKPFRFSFIDVLKTDLYIENDWELCLHFVVSRDSQSVILSECLFLCPPIW